MEDLLRQPHVFAGDPKQWEEAVAQIRRYAGAPRVEALRQGTTLHKIIMQFKGWELARMEEV